MTNTLKRLFEIRNNINNIYDDILNGYTLNVDVDDRRVTFLLTEFDTLMHALRLIEPKGYKESFILLRTSFEKFFYFWLMLEGKKYRWTTRQTIQRTTSRTDKDARDMTLEKWRTDKKNGDPHYKDIVEMQPGKQDSVIVVTYEWTGLHVNSNGKPTGEIIPSYNFMLYEYDSSVRFLTELSNIIEGEKYPDIRKEEAQTQKMIYNQFIGFDNILRNLILNDLINGNQEEMIIVHYNFLSSYVHTGKQSLEIWLNANNQFHYEPRIDDRIIQELIFLYVSKLMYLYLKVIIEYYKKVNPKFNASIYESIINELGVFSKDLWFVDNDPCEFDKIDSLRRKTLRVQTMGQITQDTVNVLYYENPLTRLNAMRSGLRQS